MSNISTFKSYCSFCRKDLSKVEFEVYQTDLLICMQCKEIITNNPVDETSPIVLFDDIPVLQSDSKVLQYFENELNLPLPAISLRNFLTEDEVYGYLIDDNKLIGLGLDGASIESLSAIILNLTNLKYLSLKNNDLQELPAFVNQLSTLEILDITKNNLTSLPPLQNLTKLNHLNFRDNKIEELPQLPPNLQSLNARWNRINFLRNPFPTSLKKLNLAQNRLKELPETFGNLRDVEELNLYGNQLKALPDNFTNLKRCKIVILRVNHLDKVPSSLFSLNGLEILDLEENNLQNIPDLSNLSNLKHLNISKNRITTLSGLNYCESLLNLDIRDNNFSELDISHVNKLQVLDISYNKFKHLPEGIESKILLTELIASGNSLVTIKESYFKHLTNLSRLSLANNLFEEIPDLTLLSNLQELYINDNKLQERPEWLEKMNLKVLTIDLEEEEKVIGKEKIETDKLNSWFE